GGSEAPRRHRLHNASAPVRPPHIVRPGWRMRPWQDLPLGCRDVASSPRSSQGELCELRNCVRSEAISGHGRYAGARPGQGGTPMATALEEKDAIREVLAEYCFRLDGGDYDGMAALFTEDGTWDTAFGKGTGRAGIAQ